MSFWKSVKNIAGYTPFTGFGALTGGGLVGKATDALITNPRQQANQAASDLYNSYEGSKKGITNAYTTAGDALTGGYNQAADTAKAGFQKAADTARTGYDATKSAYGAAGQGAVDTAKAGYAAAQGRLDSPAMLKTREDLYNRAFTPGAAGLSPDVINQMEGKVREEYGTGLREAGRGISQFAGDSQASGLAGENFARAASELGGKRAGAVRDIEMQNAQMAHGEQLQAQKDIQNEAYQRAGLDTEEAKFVSGLQEKLASGQAALSSQETNALTQLAQAEGTTVSEIQQRLASSKAGLTTEEAKMLAEIQSAQAVGKFTAASQPSTLEKYMPSLINAGATLLA